MLSVIVICLHLSYTLHIPHTGLAECISFNVSSVVPPSPIPRGTNTDSYVERRSTRLQGMRPAKENGADILMLSPNKE